jgi:hypothetical protein
MFEISHELVHELVQKRVQHMTTTKTLKMCAYQVLVYADVVATLTSPSLPTGRCGKIAFTARRAYRKSSAVSSSCDQLPPSGAGICANNAILDGQLMTTCADTVAQAGNRHSPNR